MCQCRWGPSGWSKPLPLRGLGRRALPDASRLLEQAIDGGRAGGGHVLVQHHERQPPIALHGILPFKVQDGLLLPVFQPVVTRDLGVVFVGFAIAVCQL